MRTKMWIGTLALMLLSSGIVGCGFGPLGEWLDGTGMKASNFTAKSDEGCPKPITISSGTGAHQLPLAANEWRDVAGLKKQFDIDAANHGLSYCAAGASAALKKKGLGCRAEYRKVSAKDIKRQKIAFSTSNPWVAIGGRLHKVPQGTGIKISVTRLVYVVKPGAPNVACKSYKLPVVPKRPAPKPAKETKSEGTEKQELPKPQPDPCLPLPKYIQPVGKTDKDGQLYGKSKASTTQAGAVVAASQAMEDKKDALEDKWLKEVDVFCKKLHRSCGARLTPLRWTVDRTSPTTQLGGYQVVYQLRLLNQVQGYCVKED